jgi:carbon starvation protein
LLGRTSRRAAVVATALTVAPPALLIAVSDAGAYRVFWTLFGTANQLLAALTLLAITVWLRRTGRAYWYTACPMVFVMGVTLWSLVLLARQPLAQWLGGAAPALPQLLNGIVALALFALAAVLLVEAARAVRRSDAVATARAGAMPLRDG